MERRGGSEIILLTSIVTPGNRQEIERKRKGNLALANTTFQLGLVQGILSNPDLTKSMSVLNMPGVGAYPFLYRSPFYKGSGTSISKDGLDVLVNDLGFCNIVYLKRHFKYRTLCKAIRKVFHRKTEMVAEDSSCNSREDLSNEPIVITYGIDESCLRALYRLRSEGYGFTSVLIVPDLEGMTEKVNHPLYRIADRKNTHTPFKAVDGFVFISPFMVERLQTEGKPWIVVEGLYAAENSLLPYPLKCKCEDIPSSISLNSEKSNFYPQLSGNYIMYSGELSERNGILRLLKAFSMIEDKNLKLVFSGGGECGQDIKQAALADRRIVYTGQIAHEYVLFLQRQAMMLVNPRLPLETFTRYSFPSKTLEYLASGVPVIMYNLDTLPDEYRSVCLFPKDFSIEALRDSICSVAAMSSGQRNEIGGRGQKMILQHKNAAIQSRKILDFALKLSKEKSN